MRVILNVAKKALATPEVFNLYQRLVGAPSCLRHFVTDWIRPQPGDRLLDLGCGTGAVVPHLPRDIELVGIDISASYIHAASAQYGDRGEFRVADAADSSLDFGSAFDIVYASGVLHHIPDEPARRVLDGAIGRLKPGGRFVSIDPTLVPDQGWLSRKIVLADRGEFVRSPDQLASLMNGYSPSIVALTNLLRIPYAQAIATIVKP